MPDESNEHKFRTDARRSVKHPVKCIIVIVVTQDVTQTGVRKTSYIRDESRYFTFAGSKLIFQDYFYSRICHVQDEHAVFGADLCYHRPCMTVVYLQRFEQASHSTELSPELNSKQRAWADIASGIEVGLVMNSIRDRLNRFVDVEHQFRNRDVKVFLLRHFGSNIDFAYPAEVCKCLTVYSLKCDKPRVTTR